MDNANGARRVDKFPQRSWLGFDKVNDMAVDVGIEYCLDHIEDLAETFDSVKGSTEERLGTALDWLLTQHQKPEPYPLLDLSNVDEWYKHDLVALAKAIGLSVVGNKNKADVVWRFEKILHEQDQAAEALVNAGVVETWEAYVPSVVRRDSYRVGRPLVQIQWAMHEVEMPTWLL